VILYDQTDMLTINTTFNKKQKLEQYKIRGQKWKLLFIRRIKDTQGYQFLAWKAM